MKITAKTKIIFICMAIMIAFASMALALTAIKADAEQPTISYRGEYVRESYSLNDNFSVPKAMIEKDKTYYDAIGVLTFPSGKTVIDASTTLDETGTYSLEYRAKEGKKVITANVQFQVVGTLYSVTGSRSTTEYGVHSLVPNKQGVKVSLAASEKFVYNKVINLNEVALTDNLLSFFVTPEVYGSQDTNRLFITLTDVYDKDNVVTLVLKKVQSNSGGTWAETTTYAGVYAVGQPETAVAPSNSGTVTYNGMNYTLYKTHPFGTAMQFSMIGEPYVDYGVEELSVRWDNKNNAIYLATNSGQEKMIADLDAPEFFDNPWSGFTTGEVSMAVYANQYVANKVNFVVTELIGSDITSLEYVDTTKPIITPNYGKYQENDLPNAIINKPYKIFPVSGFDAKDGELIVKTNVYYNYGGSNKVQVSIENGAFVPTLERPYTIVYTATDNAGNVATKAVQINVVTSDSPIAISLSGGQNTGLAGQSVTIPTAQVSSTLKDYEIKTTVKVGNTEYQVKDGAFVPMEAGKYVVTYTAESYVESTSVDYEVNVTAYDQPIFAIQPLLPKYFISNCVYSIETPTAYNFTNGKATENKVVVKAKADDGQVKEIDANAFKVPETSKITVIYATENKGKTAEISYTVPVVNVGYGGSLNFTKYFSTVDALATQEQDGVLVSTSSNNNKVEFINSFNLSKISFRIKLDVASMNVGKVNFYVDNLSSANEPIKITLRKTDKATEVMVNDGTAYPIEEQWLSGKVFRFDVDLKERTIICNQRTVALTTDLAGNEYLVADAYTVYLSMQIKDVSGNGAIKITNVNGQPMNASDGDYIDPVIVGEAVRGTFSIGEKITIDPIMASDVLDPSITCSVSVKAPDGTFATATDGTALKKAKSAGKTYQFELMQTGVYMITYEAVDTNGNPASYAFAINVVDKNPPEIVVDTTAVSAKVGDTITVRKCVVTDDMSAEEKVTVLITVTTPDLTIYSVEETFEITKAGKYTVTYYAYDEANNFTIVSYDVNA